jgi:hypothetical protein
VLFLVGDTVIASSFRLLEEFDHSGGGFDYLECSLPLPSGVRSRAHQGREAAIRGSQLRVNSVKAGGAGPTVRHKAVESVHIGHLQTFHEPKSPPKSGRSPLRLILSHEARVRPSIIPISGRKLARASQMDASGVA